MNLESGQGDKEDTKEVIPAPIRDGTGVANEPDGSESVDDDTAGKPEGESGLVDDQAEESPFGKPQGANEINGVPYDVYHNPAGGDIYVDDTGHPHYLNDRGEMVPYDQDLTEHDPRYTWYRLDDDGNRVSPSGVFLGDDALQTADGPTGSSRSTLPPADGTPSPSRSHSGRHAETPVVGPTAAGSATEPPTNANAADTTGANADGNQAAGDSTETKPTAATTEPDASRGEQEGEPEEGIPPPSEYVEPADGTTTPEDFFTKSAEVRQEIEALVGDIPTESVEALAAGIHDKWQRSTPVERRQLLEKLQQLKEVIKGTAFLDGQQQLQELFKSTLSPESLLEVEVNLDTPPNEVVFLIRTVLLATGDGPGDTTNDDPGNTIDDDPGNTIDDDPGNTTNGGPDNTTNDGSGDTTNGGSDNTTNDGSGDTTDENRAGKAIGYATELKRIAEKLKQGLMEGIALDRIKDEKQFCDLFKNGSHEKKVQVLETLKDLVDHIKGNTEFPNPKFVDTLMNEINKIDFDKYEKKLPKQLPPELADLAFGVFSVTNDMPNLPPDKDDRNKVSVDEQEKVAAMVEKFGIEELEKKHPVLYDLYMLGQLSLLLVAFVFASTSVVSNMGSSR